MGVNDMPEIQIPQGTYRYGCKGDNVKEIQRRLKALGYFSGTIGGNYLTKTEAAVKAFQKAAHLTEDGICGKKTLPALFSSDAPVMNEPSVSSEKSTAAATENAVNGAAVPAKGTAKDMDWWKSDIQKIFAKGMTVTVTDVKTGLAWREQRRGGSNHADVQPLTAMDTAALKKAYGGSWSWNRRAIFVTIDGINYAASMNGMPHGGSSISGNKFNGHHCIHFTNSRTHGSNKVDPNHQKAIKQALAAKL